MENDIYNDYYYIMFVNNHYAVYNYLTRGKILKAKEALRKLEKALRGMGDNVFNDFRDEINDCEKIIAEAENLPPFSLREWQDMPLRRKVSNIRTIENMPQSLKDYIIQAGKKKKTEGKHLDIPTSEDDEILD